MSMDIVDIPSIRPCTQASWRSRFLKFANLRSTGRHFWSLFRFRTTKVSPGTPPIVEITPPVIHQTVTADVSATDDVNEDATKHVNEVATKVTKIPVDVAVEDVNDCVAITPEVPIQTPAEPEKEDIFVKIDAKVAEGPMRLPPIEGGKLKCQLVENSVFADAKFYRSDFVDPEAQQPAPGAPLSTAPNSERTLPTIDSMRVSQIRANELRTAEQDKRLRPVSARRERHQRAQAVVDEIKAQKQQKKIVSTGKKVQASTRKAKVDNDRQYKICKNSIAWDVKTCNQFLDIELQKMDARFKIELKRSEVERVCQRKEAMVNARTERLHKRHVNISVAAEMRSRPNTPRPATPVDIPDVFVSRQPTNEDEPLR